jgi:hypothetical protein
VVIGKPIETRGYSDKNLGELIARTRAAIKANLEAVPHQEEQSASVSV